MVTHDMAIHANICDRIAIMYAGRIIEQADVHRIFANPSIPIPNISLGLCPASGISPVGLVRRVRRRRWKNCPRAVPFIPAAPR